MPNKKKENRYIYSKFSIHISECVESVDDEKRSLLFIMMNRHLFSGTGNECYASKKMYFFVQLFSMWFEMNWSQLCVLSIPKQALGQYSFVKLRARFFRKENSGIIHLPVKGPTIYSQLVFAETNTLFFFSRYLLHLKATTATQCMTKTQK